MNSNLLQQRSVKMKVICAGKPKTGTTSMATALRTLGFKTYDFAEHLQFHLNDWVNIYQGATEPDFLALYGDVDAVTDQPPCFFWQEISEAFPDSKVVLMVRDSDEVWAESLIKFVRQVRSTKMPFIFKYIMRHCSPTGRKIQEVLEGSALITGRNLDVDSKDKFLLKKKYREHNALVKALVPPEKLLVFNVKQGWKPLCDFLACPVPDCPFPLQNVTGRSDPFASFSAPDHVVQQAMKETRIASIVFMICLILVCLLALHLAGLV